MEAEPKNCEPEMKDYSGALVWKLVEVMTSGPRTGAVGELYAGVDLGTANIVVVVVDEEGTPVAGCLTPARVVRDGLVVEYIKAINIVRSMVQQLEMGLGRSLEWAAAAIPPGTGRAEARAIEHVVEAAGLKVRRVVDEPTAAATVLGIRDGAVVDVGGGTTGISILKYGQVVYTADEPTGGTHFTLVIAGHFKMDYDMAEDYKKNSANQRSVFPVVVPCIEKVASIISRHIKGYDAEKIFLVGGAICLAGFSEVVEKRLGIKVITPQNPMLITPLGIALSCRE